MAIALTRAVEGVGLPILCLDLASRTGWAVMRHEGRQVVSGAHRLASPGTRVGPFLSAYYRWFIELLAVEKPCVVVFEAPILRDTTALHIARKLYGLAGMTEMICDRRDLLVCETAGPTVLKYFTGYGGGSREERKASVIAECRRLGFQPENDDEADALAILHYAEHCFVEDASEPLQAELV